MFFKTKDFHHEGRTYQVRVVQTPVGFAARVFDDQGKYAGPPCYLPLEVAQDLLAHEAGNPIDLLMSVIEGDVVNDRTGDVERAIAALDDTSA